MQHESHKDKQPPQALLARRHAEACRRAQMCDRSGCGDTWWDKRMKVLELDFGMFIGVRCEGVVFFG